jgi:hypothetical protein
MLRSESRTGRRGRKPWSEGAIRAAYDDPRPRRFAFADPPYPGQAQRHYGKHKDFAGEVDHTVLLAHLQEYDGWVLCTGAAMVFEIAALCPRGTRMYPWTKPLVPFKPGVSVDFGWEPILQYGGRRRHRMASILPDYIHCPPVRHKQGGADAVIGMKPYAYSAYCFETLGARPDLGDTLDDLFPGSGAVSEAWARWCSEPRLPIFEQTNDDQMTLEPEAA